MTVNPQPPYFSLFPRWKIKLKGRHFDTTEVIEAESQAVLNTLTEHNFQEEFKKWQKHWEQCILRGWWWSVGRKLVFDQMAAPLPGNYGWLLVEPFVSVWSLPSINPLKVGKSNFISLFYAK
jgi:hypothetical protein